ncbi:MAG: PAS domain S-box protein, partial [Methanoregulaceae archaeon]|nr:PAS domain S-box protein [Methanoregulaceae archaeon]
MGVLDQEKVDRIKRILKWHPRGITISDLSSEMKMNRNLVAKYLDMLLISGQVEVQAFGAAKVYFLSRRVPISALLEFSSDLVIVVDSDNRILQVNERVPLLLGEPRDVFIGKTLDEIPLTFTQALHVSGGTRNPQSTSEQAMDVSCPVGGDDRHFRVKQVPTAFEDGSEGSTYIIEDITSRKKSEELLKISEARYRGLVQSSGEAIIGSSIDGSIISWNPAAERLYGYTAEEAIGKPIRMLVQPEALGDLDSLLVRIGRGESLRRQEMKMVRKDGGVVDVLLTISPLQGESGVIVGASSIASDITSEK